MLAIYLRNVFINLLVLLPLLFSLVLFVRFIIQCYACSLSPTVRHEGSYGEISLCGVFIAWLPGLIGLTYILARPIWEPLKYIGGPIWGLLKYIGRAIWEWLKYIGGAIWEPLKYIGGPIWGLLKYIGGPIWGLLKYIGGAIWKPLKYIGGAIWGAIDTLRKFLNLFLYVVLYAVVPLRSALFKAYNSSRRASSLLCLHCGAASGVLAEQYNARAIWGLRGTPRTFPLEPLQVSRPLCGLASAVRGGAGCTILRGALNVIRRSAEANPPWDLSRVPTGCGGSSPALG